MIGGLGVCPQRPAAVAGLRAAQPLQCPRLNHHQLLEEEEEEKKKRGSRCSLNVTSPVFTLLVTDAGQSGLSKAGRGLGGGGRPLASELLLALVE